MSSAATLLLSARPLKRAALDSPSVAAGHSFIRELQIERERDIYIQNEVFGAKTICAAQLLDTVRRSCDRGFFPSNCDLTVIFLFLLRGRG